MDINLIKKRISELLVKNPEIHIDVNLSNPKVCLENESVTLKKVYPYIFIIEEKSLGLPKTYTLQYSDILTGRIKILELNQ